jgi:hypothetical protein
MNSLITIFLSIILVASMTIATIYITDKRHEGNRETYQADYANAVIKDREDDIIRLDIAETAGLDTTIPGFEAYEQALKTAKRNNQQPYDWNNIRQTIHQFVEHDLLTPERASRLIKSLNEGTITWDPTTHRFTSSKQQKDKQKRLRDKEKWLADNEE